VAFVGGLGQDLEAKAACSRFSGVWIATVKADFESPAARMGIADGREHGVVVVGVVSMDHPLRPGPGAHGEVGIRVNNIGTKNVTLESQ
jgi:hypothetical protein